MLNQPFLNGELEEEVYIEQPNGFPLKEDKDFVCRLKKALYGLKKVCRTWYERLDMYFSKLRFIKGTIDGNLYLRKIDDDLFIIVIFLDGIIIGGNEEESDNFLMR